MEEIKLSEEEIRFIKLYQKSIENNKLSLGSLRQQYLTSEKKLISIIEKSEEDLMSNLRMIAQDKGVDETYVFDLERYMFVKK